MRLSLGIASVDQDPLKLMSVAVFDQWTKLDLQRIPVVHATEEGVRRVGLCRRLWRQGIELWAELELREDVLLPEGIHGETLAGLYGIEARLLAIVVTALPKGRTGELLGQADQARAKRSN